MSSGDIIKLLITVVMAMFGLVGILVGLLHKDMTDRITKMDEHIGPILEYVAANDEKIKALRENHEELKELVHEHDRRLNRLEVNK